MKVAIFIPTLFRPHNVERVIQSIRDTTHFPYEIYLMCPENDFETISVIEKFGCKYWIDNGDMRFVKRIQFMYENTDEDWFLTGADDIVFQPMWLEEALDYMESASVISFEDQCNPNLPGTNFLIKREYIEKYSGVVDAPNTVFHQGYYHNYCDRELVAVAAGRSQFAKCAGVLRHYHPIVDRADWDAVYMMANSYMIDDSMLFASREKLWF